MKNRVKNMCSTQFVWLISQIRMTNEVLKSFLQQAISSFPYIKTVIRELDKHQTNITSKQISVMKSNAIFMPAAIFPQKNRLKWNV